MFNSFHFISQRILKDIASEVISKEIEDPKNSTPSLSKLDAQKKSENNIFNLVESSFEFGVFLNATIAKPNDTCVNSEHDNASQYHQSAKLDTEGESLDNRFKKYPNLSYASLYHSLVNLIEIVPSLQANQLAIGEALIQAFSFLAPFLTDDLIQSLPYTIALTLTTFPKELHDCIMDVLCNSLLPISSKSFRRL